MTTIPGYNVVVQQSGAVHEATQHVKPNRPDPAQFAQQQAVRLELEKTRVSESADPQMIAAERKKEKEARKNLILTKSKKKTERETEPEPDETGNLLNTIA